MSEAESKRVFQKRLVQLLDENHMDQQELAAAIGVSTSAVSNWVSGINIPRMDKIERIASLFGVTRSSLIEYSETSEESLIDDLIKDEPVAAYMNLREQLTDDDKADIVHLIRLRAELNRSNPK